MSCAEWRDSSDRRCQSTASRLTAAPGRSNATGTRRVRTVYITQEVLEFSEKKGKEKERNVSIYGKLRKYEEILAKIIRQPSNSVIKLSKRRDSINKTVNGDSWHPAMTHQQMSAENVDRNRFW